MNWIETIWSRLESHAQWGGMLDSLREGKHTVTLAGLTRTAKALAVAGLARQLPRPLIVVTDSNETAEGMRDTIAGFLSASSGEVSGEDVVTLPALDCTPYQRRSPHPEVVETRAVALWKLCTGRARVVATPLPGALVRLREASLYRGLGLELACGDEISLDDLEEHLRRVGYEPSDPVEAPGQFSLRGGIVDVFSPENEWPVRLEFFGDEIETIREYEPSSQRSRRTISRTHLLPLSEYSSTPEYFERLVTALEREESKKAKRSRASQEDFEAYAGPFPGWEFFTGTVEPGPSSLFSLFPDSVVIWDEPAERDRQLVQFSDFLEESRDEVRDAFPSPPLPRSFYWGADEFRSLSGKQTTLHLKELVLDGESPTAQYALHSQSPPKFQGQMKNLAAEAERWRRRPGDIILTLPSSGQVERLGEILRDYDLPYSPDGDIASQEPSTSGPATIRIVQAELDEGVILPELNIHLLSEGDLFGALVPVKAPRREKSKVASLLSDLRDLKAGDYVVHVDHGIGIYRGLKQITLEDMVRDFMLITYQENAKIYVPLERLDLIQKYRSSGTGKPTLDRLGGTTWVRTKTKVKKALREMAGELLKLYAQRKMASTRAFAPDSDWQREFEAAFEFEETPDQITVIQEIKRDLESGQPMDRLLCGDVGYGKTEVAMRAAFKVVQENQQVAVLTPTTVLAFQHHETFRRRFATFPVRIEMLSRFRTPAEQKKTLLDATAGKVDILIGTHRLLSKDVSFLDLGLLIIDEEQRFGVRHKEKLKKFGDSVHVLTLSATPIPRTLNMSLGGLRDMSLIETPPKDRLAIQTLVSTFSETLVQSAILSELGRQGQVFFLHNRVESIYSIASLLQRLVPTARLGVAHGQMAERELEKVMLDFIAHKFDVLVSTAIIENGLDIPRVNTILINRADRFGLADLYQLRGRVGRSNRRAYAHLLIPAEDAITPGARRRLAALREFSELGSGFRLAALDLELRGAGNLLGGEQHGHLNAVGIDLYLQMLDQTVRELKGQPLRGELHANLNLGLDIKIPDTYITDEGQRLRMYKRISSLTGLEERDRMAEELQDRFGSLPPSVSNLLDYANLKALAEDLGVHSIERKREKVAIRFHAQARVDPEKLMKLVGSRAGSRLRPSGLLSFQLNGEESLCTGEIETVLLELLLPAEVRVV